MEEETHHPVRVARSGAVYAGALIIQKILSFAYFSVVAGSLGPERLGTYVFALSFAAFFSLVADFGFVPMAIRLFSQDEKNQQRNFELFFTVRVGFAFLAVAALGLTALILGYNSELATLLAITAAIMVMDAFTAFFYTVFRARQKLFYESIGTVIFQIIVVTAGFVALSKTSDLRFLLAVIGLGSLWHMLYSGFLLVRKAGISLRPRFSWNDIRPWLARAAPFFMAAGFIKAYNTIDSIFLKTIAGDEAVGLYAIPAKVVFTFPFVALALIAAVYPAMSNYAAHSRERLQSIFERTLVLLLALSVPIAVGIHLLAEPIILRIWPEFSASIPALQALIWAVVFLYLEYPFGALLNATGNERRNTVNRGIQLAVFVALNLALIPPYGFMGAVYASLATSVLIVLLGWLRARKIVEVMSQAMIRTTMKITVAAIVMGVFIQYAREEYHFFAVIPAAGALYVLALLVLKFYGQEDWKWLKGLLKRRG